MDTNAIFDQELARIERDLKATDERRARLVVERELVIEMRHRHGNGTSPKVGPTDAVRNMITNFPGLTRKEVRQRALMVVNTTPEKADKTVAQTILNLLGRGVIVERDGKLYSNETATAHD
jgi:hypothetical protein